MYQTFLLFMKSHVLPSLNWFFSTNDCSIDRLIDWLIDCSVIDWLIVRLLAWLIDWLRWILFTSSPSLQQDLVENRFYWISFREKHDKNRAWPSEEYHNQRRNEETRWNVTARVVQKKHVNKCRKKMFITIQMWSTGEEEEEGKTHTLTQLKKVSRRMKKRK